MCFILSMAHLLRCCLTVSVVGEVGELGVLEVQVEVEIKGGYQRCLDPSSCLMARRRRLEEELWHLSLRR